MGPRLGSGVAPNDRTTVPAMPIYEYECSECGAHFEQMQRIGDPRAVVCPNGHMRVRRRLSQPAIIFKGSGFYATDHGRNGGTRTPRKRRAEPEPGSSANQTTEPSSAE